MIRFFTINDPFKLIIALGIFLILRIILLIIGVPISVNEIEWLAVGEKINNGFLLYKEIWTDIPPFSALFYAFVTFFFGKSILALKIFSIIFGIIQIIIFSNLVNQFDTQTEKNYLGSFIYAIIGSLYIGFLSLSPAMLSATFILLALDSLLKIIRMGPKQNYVFFAGLWFGIAFLFFSSIIVYLFAALITLVILTEFRFKAILNFFLIFCFPIASVMLYFYMYNSLDSLNEQFFQNSIVIHSNNLLGYKLVSTFFGTTFLVFLFAVINLVGYSNFINFQNRVQQLMFFWLVCGAFSFFITDKPTLIHFWILIPAIVFIITQLFLSLKKSWKTDLFFNSYTASLVIISFLGVSFKSFYPDKIFANKDKIEKSIKGKKVLTLSNENYFYYNNSLATPFLDWNSSEYIFKDLENYRNVALIYEGFKNDYPDIIYDSNNIFEKVIEKIPEFGEKYKRESYSVWVKQ